MAHGRRLDRKLRKTAVTPIGLGSFQIEFLHILVYDIPEKTELISLSGDGDRAQVPLLLSLCLRDTSCRYLSAPKERFGLTLDHPSRF